MSATTEKVISAAHEEKQEETYEYAHDNKVTRKLSYNNEMV